MGWIEKIKALFSRKPAPKPKKATDVVDASYEVYLQEVKDAKGYIKYVRSHAGSAKERMFRLESVVVAYIEDKYDI